MSDSLLLLACVLLVVLCVLTLVLLLRRPPGGDAMQHLRLLAEQAALGQRAEAEATRTRLADAERALQARAEQSRLELQATLGTLSTSIARDQGDARALLEQKLREMGEQSAQRLADLQRTVSEGLHQAVERSVQGSFQRVVDQFAQVQKAVGDVQAVTAQIGDLKRIFSNVKTRGGWGEMHLRALLDDVLPAGAYHLNQKLRADSDDVVEFALVMPMKGDVRPLLAIDAKFPAEDFDRLLLAAEAGDAEGERAARKGLELRLRGEAKKIGGKYINPPVTVDFAVMYLPTDGLYVEAARMPGLIEGLNRDHRVLLMGPSLVPALLRTIQLGILTLSLEQKADEIQRLLGTTKTEMAKMDLVLERLAKQAGAFSNTIDDARTRTRAVGRHLREVEGMEGLPAPPSGGEGLPG